MIEWKLEHRKVLDLVPWDHNPQQLTAKQAEDIEESLRRFGLAEPIVINQDNTIIGGHMRTRLMRIMQEYGADFDMPVMMPDRMLDEMEVAELNVRLNKNAGQWDFDGLANDFELANLLEWGSSHTNSALMD